MLLAGITASTAEGWRKRGTGPSYVLVGNRYLYPRQAVQKYMEDRMRVVVPVSARGSL
jgi:predicted site-specific integrase-resolvase